MATQTTQKIQIISGSVRGIDGHITNQLGGFNVERLGHGHYHIKFDPAPLYMYSVVGDVFSFPADKPLYNLLVEGFATEGFKILIRDMSGNHVDHDFSFIAIAEATSPHA